MAATTSSNTWGGSWIDRGTIVPPDHPMDHDAGLLVAPVPQIPQPRSDQWAIAVILVMFGVIVVLSACITALSALLVAVNVLL